MNAINVSVGLIVMVCLAVFVASINQGDANEVIMHKSENCECCTEWADHLKKEGGFTVVERVHDNMNEIKKTLGMPEKLASCHTGVIGGYLIEGHVPAADVKRLLKEKPDVVGLTAPGMPMKSPGMQKEGLPAKGYDVLAIKGDGSTYVFSHY